MAVAWSLAFPEQVHVGGRLLLLVSTTDGEIFKWGKSGDVGVGCCALALRVVFQLTNEKSICSDVFFYLLVTKNFLVKVQLSNAAIFSCRLTARMLEDRDEGEHH